jgi:hypothetical protein
VEKLVIQQIGELANCKHASTATKNALTPFRNLSAWEALPAAEQARLVQRWVQRVEYDGHQGKIAITFHHDGEAPRRKDTFE